MASEALREYLEYEYQGPLPVDQLLADSTAEVDWLERPLYKEIAKRVEEWYDQKSFPIKFKQYPVMLIDINGTEHMEERTPKFLEIMEKYHPDWEKCWRELFRDNVLDLDGIYWLLGCRKTISSSRSLLPPPVSVLLEAFQKPHKPNQVLWMGTRALAKHCHRDQTDQFWGNQYTGKDPDKNKLALSKLTEILSDVHWCNAHEIVHGVVIFELRNEPGYGVRWQLKEGQWTFRGFLEPPSADGHEKGWKH